MEPAASARDYPTIREPVVGDRGRSMGRGGTERNVTTPNCLIPGRAMRELIGNTGRVHVAVCKAACRLDSEQRPSRRVPLSGSDGSSGIHARVRRS